MATALGQLEAKIFRGLADYSRLTILEILSKGSSDVTRIVKMSKLSQSNASMHLACLLECGLVRRERQGRKMLYSLAMDEVKDVLDSVQSILKKNAKEIYECTRY